MQGAMGFPVDLERNNQKGYNELSFSGITNGLRWLTLWSFFNLLDSQQHEVSLFPRRDSEAYIGVATQEANVRIGRDVKARLACHARVSDAFPNGAAQAMNRLAAAPLFSGMQTTDNFTAQ